MIDVSLIFLIMSSIFLLLFAIKLENPQFRKYAAKHIWSFDYSLHEDDSSIDFYAKYYQGRIFLGGLLSLFASIFILLNMFK